VRLFRDAIRDAFERGLSRFDFVGRAARWKDEWATARTEHDNVVLYPGSLPGRVRAFARGRLRPLARKAARGFRDRNDGGGH
jgi:CelD/BcsL family acetyltransferase involved in cellulose biosynthesis